MERETEAETEECLWVLMNGNGSEGVDVSLHSEEKRIHPEKNRTKNCSITAFWQDKLFKKFNYTLIQS